MSYFTVPARKRAAWLPELNLGQLVMAESGIFNAYYFRTMLIEARPDWFYSRQGVVEDGLDRDQRFNMRHMMIPFVLLGWGVLISCVVFVTEWKK